MYYYREQWIRMQCTAVLLATASLVTANPDAKRLYDDLLSNYNRYTEHCTALAG